MSLAEKDMNPDNGSARYFKMRGGIYQCRKCGIKGNGYFTYHFKDSKIGQKHQQFSTEVAEK